MVWIWVAALLAAGAAWGMDRRRRTYADLPTTPAAAVFAGRNEVKGRAWTDAPMRAAVTGIECVMWEYVLEEEREHTHTSGSGSNRTTTKSRRWHEIERRREVVGEILVVDDSGSVPVRLPGADVVPRRSHRETFRRPAEGGFLTRMLNNRTGRYRETEEVVAVGDALFVVGEAELDPVRVVPVLTGDVLVSTRSEASHVGWLTAGTLAAVAAAVAFTGYGTAAAVDPADPGRPGAWGPGLAGAALVLVVAWILTTYNRIRQVAQGADRAWSLLDVQLRRRHDLIPALSQVVAAHAAHEEAVHATAVEARRSAVVGGAEPVLDDAAALGREATRQTGALRQLLARAETYPSLAADASFQRLQSELADTEDRIAATRTFHNAAVTLFRDRCERFPTSIVARRIRPEHRELLGADGFERTVPSARPSFA